MKKTLGVILAGGKSSRMGTNKALLSFQGARLIDHIAGIVSQALNCSPKDLYISGKIAGYRCVADEMPGIGPLGGISSVIRKLRQGYDQLLIVPVDMPRITAPILRKLVEANTESYNATTYSGFELPLCVKLNFETCPSLTMLTLPQTPPAQRSLRNWLSFLKVNKLRISNGKELLFCNTNTPEDWREFCEHSIR